MKFEEMNIEKNVLDSLRAISFESPTKIQSEAIPVIKQGHDVIGQSKTGSGKTAAFGIPLVEKVVKGGNVQALVLAPTRELSMQIAGELVKFSQFKGLHVQTVYGGVSMGPQVSGLKRAEIVVGTPGRILDHMRRRTFDAGNLKMFVLDEADKMIDMGFVEDIESIERHIPKERQTLLFSATMPPNLMKIRDKFTRNATKIETEKRVEDEILRQYYCDIDHKKKFSLLVGLLERENPELSIVFCNSRRETDDVARNLRMNGVKATALHGGLSQDKREKIMEELHRGIITVLVATDVAARGLDVKNITHIFNYRIPKTLEEYVNRIGRTARAGESGKAISLLSRDDHDSFRTVVRGLSSRIEKIEIPEFRPLPFRRHEQQYDDRRFGARKPFRRRFR